MIHIVNWSMVDAKIEEFLGGKDVTIVCGDDIQVVKSYVVTKLKQHKVIPVDGFIHHTWTPDRLLVFSNNFSIWFKKNRNDYMEKIDV